MLASAANRVKGRWIYVTGGNDDMVGIWDLTEVSREQDELLMVGNGTLVSFASFACSAVLANPRSVRVYR